MFVEDLRARWAIILVVMIMTAVWNVPYFFEVGKEWDRIVLGLDIQGGLHLVMGVDTEGVISESTKRLSSTIKTEMNDDGIQVSSVQLKDALKGEIEMLFTSVAEREKGVKFIADTRYAVQLQVLEEDGARIVVRYLEVWLRDYKKRIVEQAIETIRNRIDEVGVKEPSITAQGDDRILVQFPGIEDATTAKELINTTARLEFMLVADEMKDLNLQELIDKAEIDGKFTFGTNNLDQGPSEAQDGKTPLKYSAYIKKLNGQLKGKIPEGTMIIFEKPQGAKSLSAARIPYLVKTDTGLGGDDLKDAFVGYNEFQTPEVRLSFNPRGAKKFADLTGNNVGKQMAVVLDRVIKTAPNLTERIPSGSAVITLGRASEGGDSLLKEAQMITMALRAGALPAALEQMEERTVGPTLGADSIEKAKYAGLIGGALVIAFMLLYYKSFGLIANVALALNIFMVLAILSSLRATLTLPGVAGIVLTVGMAVDANVIIFERIKEELAKGTGLALAVKEGYGRAFSAILDANITTAAVCIVLMYYGTGPVRGFAVTLIIGIVTSMFTAIFFSRAIFDFATQRLGYKKLAV